MLKFNSHIGLDVGSCSIKLAQLESTGKDKYRLFTFGQVQTPKSENQLEADENKIGVIKKLLKDCKVSTNKVVVSLPESLVYTRVIEMPFMQEQELASAIRWQAEQYIPVPLSDVVLKHQVLSSDSEKLSVLLVAAPSTLLNDYVNLLSRSGLETLAIETEILAVARSLVGFDRLSPTTLSIHMGAETSTVCVLSRGDLEITQSISTGGNALTRAISSTLGIDSAAAEEYKKSYGLDETKLDGKILNACRPIVDLIGSELKRALAYYESRVKDSPVKRIVLSGGSALLPGLVSYLTTLLNLEVQIGNPILNIEVTNKQRQEIGEEACLYATAIGLGLKQT